MQGWGRVGGRSQSIIVWEGAGVAHLILGSGGVLDTPEGGTGVLLGMKILHRLAFSKVRKLLRQWGLVGDTGV